MGDLELSDADLQTVRHAAHWVVVSVLMSVVKTMGPTAVGVLAVFLIGGGLLKAAAN